MQIAAEEIKDNRAIVLEMEARKLDKKVTSVHFPSCLIFPIVFFLRWRLFWTVLPDFSNQSVAWKLKYPNNRTGIFQGLKDLKVNRFES